MTFNFVDPYTGKEDKTCSVSFKAQQEMGAGTTGSPQTEAEFNASKQLGEWGVIVAKMKKGEIPNGTKVLIYENANADVRGYFFVKNNKLYRQTFFKGKKLKAEEEHPAVGESFIEKPNVKTTIPEALSDKPKPEGVPFTEADGITVSQNPGKLTDGQVMAVSPSGDFIIFNVEEDKFQLFTKDASGSGNVLVSQGYYMPSIMSGNTWLKPDGKTSTPTATPKVTKPPSAPSVIASPTPAPAVTPGSDSVGSMSHEDVAAMFVKIKDDLAKEQGLNIKGANPQLDQLVFGKIGEATGYTSAEVKAKIDAYKAEGNKLSALKKKVLAGTKKVPEGKPQPTKATPAAPLNTPKVTNKPAQDPKPNGVPTTATPKLANEVKAEVKKEVAADPKKVYSDEDVAAAYIIAKDFIVASNTKGWTLYTKNDEFDLEIAIQVGLKTGLNPLQQKQAIANYLASGKKLSALKKQLAKQGAFTPKADSLKSGKATPDPDKKKDVDAKADAGYTPTPEPATKAKAGDPKIDTGKPAPKTVVAEAKESGDISGVDDKTKLYAFNNFKGAGSQSYLSSGPASNYEGFVKAQIAMKQAGHDLTLLQLIRIADEQGAKKAGVANGHLFEKQVATWLTTPAATAHIKANEAKLAKAAEEAAKKAEIEKAAKLLAANQPPLPADSAMFDPDMNEAKSLAVQREMLSAKPFGPRERAAIVHYTTNSYREMNGYLRGISSSISEKSRQAIPDAQAGMRPNTKPMIVRRGTGASQFVSLGVKNGDTSLLWGITGKTFEDKGFLSTSSAGRAAFGGEVAMEIELPVGAPAMYVDYELQPDGTKKRFSAYPGEKEMLLGKGMKYKILQVRKEGSTFVVRARVVDWPGKED